MRFPEKELGKAPVERTAVYRIPAALPLASQLAWTWPVVTPLKAAAEGANGKVTVADSTVNAVLIPAALAARARE